MPLTLIILPQNVNEPPLNESMHKGHKTLLSFDGTSFHLEQILK